MDRFTQDRLRAMYGISVLEESKTPTEQEVLEAEKPNWHDHFDNDKEAGGGVNDDDDPDSYKKAQARKNMTPEQRKADKKKSEDAVAKFLADKKAKAAKK